MLDTATIIAFATTTDAAEAKHFYSDLLGLTLVSDEPVALVYDANGTMLRIQKVHELVALPYTTLGWKVEDIDAVYRTLREKGVVFEQFADFDQDDKGIKKFDNGARVGWFRDPDGNLLSVTQES